MASAVAGGASRESGVLVSLKPASEADTSDLLGADGVLFGTPENLGYMSGALKDFFDRTYYPAQPYQLSLPYALFVSAGNDGSGAVREVARILLGYPMKKIAEPIIAYGEPDNQVLERCLELGESVAAGISLGVF